MQTARNPKSQRKNHLQRKNIKPVDASYALEYAKAYLSALIKDASKNLESHYSIADVTRDLNVLKNRLDSEGLGFATKTLPCLIKGLLELYEGHDASFPQFKLQRGMAHPVFLNRLFHLALESTSLEVKRNAFDILYSISVAFKKYKGDYPKSVLVKQFTDFIKTDHELAEIDLFEETVYSILEGARRIVHSIVHDVTLDHIRGFMPRPGPGATNTPVEKTERFRPRVLYKQINDVLDYQEWWFATPWHACLRSREFLLLHKNAEDEPVARFKFVQKTQDKPRGICIEQNEMQVMQQAVRVYLYRLFDKRLKPQIALDDQSINAGLALHASFNKQFATIDMSEASDRISRELVSWLFQDNQELHDILMALSTRWIKPPKEIEEVFPSLIRTQKYAPMGSALCFPVMSLVHYALVTSIIEHGTYNIHDPKKQVYVYGDDIVIPSETVHDVFHWLPKFGMKLNKTKSFYHSHFRESCGVHALHGVDVTPVYIKYTPYHNNAKAVASAYAVEKQLYNKGFNETAYFQRCKIRDAYQYNDFVPDGLSQAGFARPFSAETLFRFKIQRKRKWNANLQCYEYRVDRVTDQVVKKYISNDEDGYLRWLWTNAKNEGPPGVPYGKRVIGDSSGDLKISTRRVPESALIARTVDRIIQAGIERYPYARVPIRRDSVVCHKVVLRQTGSLQQQGDPNSFGCVFC